jgi:hypothetical protein
VVFYYLQPMSITDSIRSFLSESKDPALFAGAGVSAAAGLPTWPNLLKQLAELVGTQDPLIKQVMKERVHENDFLNAADQYFLCPKIDKKDKLTWLRNALTTADCSALSSIPKLPFRFYVTTNYDTCLLDAWAAEHGKTPMPVNLGDPSLRQAPYESEFFIARIHGRAELPETIALSSQHYSNLLDDSHYIDFLNWCFTRTQLLFIGFSFLDPAIDSILKIVDSRVGNYHHGSHLALLPSSADPALITKLQSLRIRTEQYDDTHDHALLWSALHDVPGTATSINEKGHVSDPFFTARKYLSACYARAQLADHLVPLRESITQGMVSHLIEENATLGTDRDSIVQTIAKDLAIPQPLADRLTARALSDLERHSYIYKSGDVFFPSQATDTHLTSKTAIETLASALADRLLVREGITPNKAFSDFTTCLLNHLIFQRGWDLGAAFASQNPPESVNIDDAIHKARNTYPLGHEYPAAAIRRVVEDLLTNPTDEEGKLLALLGKVSFALEIISHSPHDTLFHNEALPQKIYLDANVLMPALTEGHILHDAYKRTMTALREAVARSGGSVKILTMYGFLNEIVSHRQLSIEEMQHKTNEELSDLMHEALALGTQNMNVYIGAYANMLHNDKQLGFSDFLRNAAPYHKESELKYWLREHGIDTVSTSEAKAGNPNYANILHTLERSYSDRISARRKTAILIEHDAAQLAALESDIGNGVRSLFVTADKALTGIIHSSGHHNISSNIISHAGLIQLVELLVGETGESRGTSLVMWSTKITEDADHIHNYLVSAALHEYHDALSMDVRKLIDEIAEDAAFEMQKTNVTLNSKVASEQKEAFKILGRFQNRFFEKMREFMKKD